jgi:hypothetical protein
MNQLSGEIIFYFTFIFLALLSGAILWVIRTYAIPAVLSFIFAIFAPLLTLLVVAQRESGVTITSYILEEVSSGNSLVRILVVIHLYLLVWLLFIAVRGIIYLVTFPTLKEKWRDMINFFSNQMNKHKNKAG